jgi:hypothetical protein
VAKKGSKKWLALLFRQSAMSAKGLITLKAHFN